MMRSDKALFEKSAKHVFSVLMELVSSVYPNSALSRAT